ncbi:hypothetical protein HK105_205528 [Polyrhizophydium stewartii]|uniref:G-protein coupled receptors family 2 profile 2 domain-containing protein n=1 Tax=Polyrhizophydium stewartii TaxID=2732419 RepID=A0ABR4N680_9FUNG
MALDPATQATASWLVLVSAALSVLGVLFVLYAAQTGLASGHEAATHAALNYIIKPSWFNNMMGRFVLAMAVVDLVGAIAKAIGRNGINAGEMSTLCQQQGIFIQYSNLSSVLINLAIAVCMLYIVFWGDSFSAHRYETIIFTACFFAPVGLVVPLLLIEPTDDNDDDDFGTLIGDADFWCWIKSSERKYQILFFYIELWIIFMLQVTAYIVAWVRIQQMQVAAELGRRSTTTALRRYNVIMSRRMQAYTFAFLFVWTPSSLNRVVPLMTGQNFTPLTLLQAFMSPLRGFANALAFLYIDYLLEAGTRVQVTQTISEFESHYDTTPQRSAATGGTGGGGVASGGTGGGGVASGGPGHVASEHSAGLRSIGSIGSINPRFCLQRSNSTASRASHATPKQARADPAIPLVSAGAPGGPAGPAGAARRVRFAEKSATESNVSIGIDTIARMARVDEVPPPSYDVLSPRACSPQPRAQSPQPRAQSPQPQSARPSTPQPRTDQQTPGGPEQRRPS